MPSPKIRQLLIGIDISIPSKPLIQTVPSNVPYPFHGQGRLNGVAGIGHVDRPD